MFELLLVDYDYELESFIVTDQHNRSKEYRFSLLPIKFICNETDLFRTITPPDYAINLICFSSTDIADEVVLQYFH